MTQQTTDKLIPPKYTTPLTKLIRTLEGILVIAAVVILVVAAIVNDISPDLAAKLGTGLTAITVFSRTILKAFARELGNPGAILPTEVQASASIPTQPGAVEEDQSNVLVEPEQATQEFSMPFVPAGEDSTPLPAVPPYDYQEDYPTAPLPLGADTPESRGEDPNL
jgi:hypothetical protein